MTNVIAQVIGYLSSALLATALLVNNDLKFRWLNTAGNVFFIIYGILLQAFPIILTNSILISINIFYLIRIYTSSEEFDVLEFKPGDKIIDKFLAFYGSN